MPDEDDVEPEEEDPDEDDPEESDDEPELEPELDPEVAVEVEPELALALFMRVEAVPPQPTNIAVVKMTKQIFTPDSPALIWK